MAYIGPAPNPGQNREVDDISSGFNGSEVNFTLQVGGSNVSPGSANAIIVSLGGVVQNPGTDYTVAASTLTFTTAPANGLSFFGLVLGQGIDTQTIGDASVTAAKLASPLDLLDNQKIRFGTGNDIEIYSDGSNGYITHTDGGGDPLYISSQNDIRLRVANTEEGVKIKSNGEVELYHNDTLQCETSANGLAFPSGKGIDFSATSGTGTSELFDDYEEGTFTPEWNAGSAASACYAGGLSYSSQVGVYRRVGHVVHFIIKLQVSSGTLKSGQLILLGLPFTSGDFSSYSAAGGAFVSYTTGYFSDTAHIPTAFVSPGQSYLNFFNTAGNNFAGTHLAQAAGRIDINGHYFTS
jgi:hypothetical protein